ncbi:dihydroneopterin triphosphate diphosphatase [Candidatus Vallotia tarda]|uniref:Dihydroneopterin triphosphate pyrophosphatase n=1 Tax=Candidatus Vallotiella hemipterorum TaxID=1177213 RepID=A0A916JR88_9BURK|nr:dihydroneopterin triphosphate diphosphatase [Candidatus Vallotia tarda]CAG7596928.1 Dihydroneopterin triphosphate pyrophosphatase [Candidatus Vallotia tarda]
MSRLFKIPESVLVVIHTVSLNVLIINRADFPCFWQSVTGSINTYDEPLLLAVEREVFEETGIIVNTAQIPVNALLNWQHSVKYKIYPQWRHRYAPGVKLNIEHWFSLCVPETINITLAPQEHISYMWLPYRDAAKRCFSESNCNAILQLPRRLAYN